MNKIPLSALGLALAASLGAFPALAQNTVIGEGRTPVGAGARSPNRLLKAPLADGARGWGSGC